MTAGSETQCQSVQVSPNRKYFVDAAGNPFFWLGDTAWPLFTHYSVAHVERFLTDRAERGFR